MCHLVVERYSYCRCVYYEHDLDKCAKFGERGHEVEKVKERTILVGQACGVHSEYPYVYGVLVDEAGGDSEFGGSSQPLGSRSEDTIRKTPEDDPKVVENLKSLVAAQCDEDILPPSKE
jgi:hypothetical protein